MGNAALEVDVAPGELDELTAACAGGDFRDLTVGIRREASIDQLRLTTYASNLLLEFVGYLRADYVARRPASFHTIEGVAA